MSSSNCCFLTCIQVSQGGRSDGLLQECKDCAEWVEIDRRHGDCMLGPLKTFPGFFCCTSRLEGSEKERMIISSFFFLRFFASTEEEITWLKRVGWERVGRNEGRGFLEKGIFLNLSWKDEWAIWRIMVGQGVFQPGISIWRDSGQWQMACLSLLRQQLGGEKWIIRGRRKGHICHISGGGLVAKWCPTLCSPMDCSTLGSSVWISPGWPRGAIRAVSWGMMWPDCVLEASFWKVVMREDQII